MDTQSTAELIAQLQETKSARRRAAAKALRKFRNSSIELALLQALQNELKDSRTWETQYQLIMALGMNGGDKAILPLQEIAERGAGSAMVSLAIGDALIRIASRLDALEVVWKWIQELGNKHVLEGMMRGVYLEKIHLSDEVIDEVLHNLEEYNTNDPIMFWAAAAALQWRTNSSRNLLDQLLESSEEGIREAARNSSNGKYVTYRIL